MDKKTIVAVTKIVLEELEKSKSLKKDKMLPYKKTEMLLYNYHKFKEVISEKKEEIEEVKETGIKKGSKSIVRFNGTTGVTSSLEIEEELVEDKIDKIKESIMYTDKCIKSIDKALKKIKSDKYYSIIEKKYFENKTLEDIAYELECDVSTVSRNKNRLVNELSIILFSDEVIYDIFH